MTESTDKLRAFSISYFKIFACQQNLKVLLENICTSRWFLKQKPSHIPVAALPELVTEYDESL